MIIMIFLLFNMLVLVLYSWIDQEWIFVGLQNFMVLFGDLVWFEQFWNVFGNNFWFFVIYMLVQNFIGIVLVVMLFYLKLWFVVFYWFVIFILMIFFFVIVGFVWKLILLLIWGIVFLMLDVVGLKFLFVFWFGKEEYVLIILLLILVWQFVGILMMLIYVVLLFILEEILEVGEIDGIIGVLVFWKIKLFLILLFIGIILILIFVGNFNVFDLIYVFQGVLVGLDFLIDILGIFFYWMFFGF